jgi:uncharacterized protein YndB with AHSA1/START domain
MRRIRAGCHIDAPVERVFDVALDLTLLPRYMSAVKEVSPPSGAPDAVGTTYSFRSVTFGRTSRGTIEVLDVRRPTYLRTLTSYDNGIRVTWTQTMAPAASGTNEVDEVDVEVPGGIAWWLLEPLVEREMRRVIGASTAGYADAITGR